jgi:hypothetical protein
MTTGTETGLLGTIPSHRRAAWGEADAVSVPSLPAAMPAAGRRRAVRTMADDGAARGLTGPTGPGGESRRRAPPVRRRHLPSAARILAPAGFGSHAGFTRRFIA